MVEYGSKQESLATQILVCDGDLIQRGVHLHEAAIELSLITIDQRLAYSAHLARRFQILKLTEERGEGWSRSHPPHVELRYP